MPTETILLETEAPTPSTQQAMLFEEYQQVFQQTALDPLTDYIVRYEHDELRKQAVTKIKIEREQRCQHVANNIIKLPPTAENIQKITNSYQYSCPALVEKFSATVPKNTAIPETTLETTAVSAPVPLTEKAATTVSVPANTPETTLETTAISAPVPLTEKAATTVSVPSNTPETTLAATAVSAPVPLTEKAATTVSVPANAPETTLATTAVSAPVPLTEKAATTVSVPANTATSETIATTDKKTCEALYIARQFATAISVCQQEATAGGVSAQFYLGASYLHTNNPQSAYSWFKKAAEQGHSEAQYQIGQLYYTGNGVGQSHDKAVEWFELAAKQHNTQAQFMLNNM
ncbi:tetratricopeptide repeat protein [Beggiatoa leptomitoformis]|nr:tetratricopeptide repeat protein [Beggiatoa leptomitoformis]